MLFMLLPVMIAATSGCIMTGYYVNRDKLTISLSVSYIDENP